MFRAGQDPGVACRVYAGCTLWVLGYPDQALARTHEALALATEFAHPFTYAFALELGSLIRQFRREAQNAYEHADAAVTLSYEQGFTLWLAMGTFLRGWALTALGQREEGLTQMHQGLTDWRASGAGLFVSYFLSLMGERIGAYGQVEAGLDVLNEGLEVMAQTGEYWWQAEGYRLKGELLLQRSSDNQTEAETCSHKALDVARRQQAKFWELRAAASLARLWQSQGRRQDAYELLAPVYSWFTEGFDTVDLKEAKALLQELEE